MLAGKFMCKTNNTDYSLNIFVKAKKCSKSGNMSAYNSSLFVNGIENFDKVSLAIAIFYFIIASFGFVANVYTNILMRSHQKTHFKNPFFAYAISLTFTDSATLLEIICNG